MMRVKLPVVDTKPNYWPTVARCPICKKSEVHEPHSMAILGAGALKMNRRRQEGTMSDDLDGFLHLAWHGAHDNGQGINRDIGCILNIVQDARGGQADLYFCSTKCLREFLNGCVDELERNIEKTKRTTKRSSNNRIEPAPVKLSSVSCGSLAGTAHAWR